MFKSTGIVQQLSEPQELKDLLNYKPIDLSDAADDLWRAALNLEDDNGLYSAFQNVQIARSQVRGETNMLDGISNVNSKKLSKAEKKKKAGSAPSSQMALVKEEEEEDKVMMSLLERTARRERILKRCIDKLMGTPQQSLMLSALVQDPVIQELKKGAINKFLAWLKEYPDNFHVTPIDGSTMYRVTLLSAEVPDKHKKRNFQTMTY